MIASFEPYQGKIYHTSLPEEAEQSLRQSLEKRVGQLDNQMIALGFEGSATADRDAGQSALVARPGNYQA